MRMMLKRISILFIAGVLPLLCGCDRAASPSPEEAASFSQEDGIALGGSTIRLAFGESSIDQPLGDDGELTISGLPRVGDLMLTVLDRQEQIQGAMTLFLSEGAVIDATTDGSGVGHITLRGDTDEVVLVFILKDDGSFLCTL